MKGYCVDVRGFNLDKKKLVKRAISELTDLSYRHDENAELVADKITNIGPARGAYLVRVVCGYGELTDMQKPYEISFNDLMLEAGFNYEDNGVKDFKWIDWSERSVTENKPTSNKTRPRITREQYDAVMAQSDKRTFTKALDDLLAIEKEHSEDDLLGDCYQGHKVNSFKVSRCASGDESSKISRLSAQVKQLERENGFLVKGINSWRESHEKMHNSKEEVEAKLEKKGRVIGFVSLLLIFSLVAQLAVIFFQ